jgi:hypothetical protein
VQDFKLGGGALKKIAPSGGRRENVWGISCEKSRFLRQKIIFFQILGGRAPGAPPPPGSAPALCDQVSQLLAAGRWFSSGTPVSSTNKTDRHDITEILLKGALHTTNQPLQCESNLGQS